MQPVHWFMKIFLIRASSADSPEEMRPQFAGIGPARSWSVIVESDKSCRPLAARLTSPLLRSKPSAAPRPVFAGRERGNNSAGLVGVDRGGDGRAFELGRDRHAAELLARRRVTAPLSN